MMREKCNIKGVQLRVFAIRPALMYLDFVRKKINCLYFVLDSF